MLNLLTKNCLVSTFQIIKNLTSVPKPENKLLPTERRKYLPTTKICNLAVMYNYEWVLCWAGMKITGNKTCD